MHSFDIAVVDYGLGNLLSVRRAFERCGAAVIVTADPDTILRAPRIVLPGVGGFRAGMTELGLRGLGEVVCESASAGTPLLGICLGMQMLFEESSEQGTTRGLGLLRGRVDQIDVTRPGARMKLPHIGWNKLLAGGSGPWHGTILESLPDAAEVYFLHSFVVSPADPADCLAECEYGATRWCASVTRGNIAGCQFHPERSGATGLSILDAFLRWQPSRPRKGSSALFSR